MKQQRENTDRPDNQKRKIKIISQQSGKSLRQHDSNINYTFSRQSRNISRNTSPSSKPNLSRSTTSPQVATVAKNNSQKLKKQEFEKLLEISSRCLDYYNKFLQEKNNQMKVIQDAFKTIHEGLDFAFESLIKQIQQKQKSIKQYLGRRQQNLRKVKNDHQNSLTKSLQEIKSIHLANYMKQYYSGEQENSHNINLKNIDQLLNSYACTLSNFYQTMEDIQKFNFKQNVEESINFINNLISQEIRIIVDQKLHKNAQLDNFSFSFNHQKCGGYKLSNVQSKASLFPDSTHQLLQQIALFQDRRKLNIKKYQKILL